MVKKDYLIDYAKCTYIEVKAFFLIGVCVFRPSREIEYLPECWVFGALIDHFKFLAGVLILLKKGDVFLGCRHVRRLVGWQYLSTYPQVELVLRLDDGDTAWVQAVVARATLIHVRDHQLAYDALRVDFLVAHYAENAWVYR